MNEHLYASFNDALQALWETIAPGVAFQLGHPSAPAKLPIPCLRIYWLKLGGSTAQASETHAIAQLDLFVGGDDMPTAASQAAALDKGMGFADGAGFGRFGVAVAGSDPPEFIGSAQVVPSPEGWTNERDEVPRVIHLARVVELYATPGPYQ